MDHSKIYKHREMELLNYFHKEPKPTWQRPTAFELWVMFTDEYSRLSVDHSVELSTIDQYIKNEMQTKGKNSRPHPFNYIAFLLNEKLGTKYPITYNY